MQATVNDNVVHVFDLDARNLFDQNWYGTWDGDKLVLSLVEAAALFERQKIEIENYNLQKFITYCSEKEENFMARFLVYKDLRERGLPVRIGFKDCDFRVYERGAKPSNNKKIKWIVFCTGEDYACEMNQLGRAIKLAKNIKAEALWVVVDDDESITAYKIAEIMP